MPKTTHTVTLPDGKTAKRVSQNRVYSHVVVGRPIYEAALARANRLVNAASDFKFYSEYLDGTSRFLVRQSWERDDDAFAAKCAKEIEHAREALGDCKTPAELAEKRRAAAVARVEDEKARGVYDAWHALTWASRLDLAQKAQGHSEWAAYETRVLPTTIKG